MIIIAIALGVLLLIGIAENCLHSRMLAKIPLRILVNGTRGKTTLTRMIASVLNAADVRTYAKTTGSEARRMMPDGTEQTYRKKHRPVSMMEQLPFVRLAVKGRAQAIVVECMAQRIENQRLIAEKLIRPHYVLMTNAYVDHVEEIGRTEEETVHVLAQSIMDESCVIAHDERFGAYTDQLIIPKDEADMVTLSDCLFPVHPENVRLVLALADQLKIPRETVYKGILNTVPDIGMYKKVEAGSCCVWNAFAANDPVSFAAMLSECGRRGPYHLLYNHRKDRSYRLEAFAQVIIASSPPPVSIGVIGEDKEWCSKAMARMTGMKAQAIHDAPAWIKSLGTAQEPCQLLCGGNIKGEGRLLMVQLIKEAQANV